MNIIFLAHRRSLNKTEGLINAYKDCHLTLVSDAGDLGDKFTFLKHLDEVCLVKGFDLVNITRKIKKCDKIICVSENLLPIQSQLESYYGIKNLSPYAAEILSNKQTFDNFCRSIGLGNFVPKSITPTFHSQLEIFNNNEIFTKPDIGTGSNVFIPDSNQNQPKIEYRRWNNKHHFMKYLNDKDFHNDFFGINKSGIQNHRFNYRPCKIMVQEYHWSEEPSIAPIGHVSNGIVNTEFYLKMSKVKYGDQIDPNANPIESHSVSQASDIAKDRAVWVVTPDEVDEKIRAQIEFFMNTVIKSLKVKELFFAGPDFHISNEKLIAIDFNPRPGQFMNILDQLSSNSIFSPIVHNTPVVMKKKLLWGCATLTPGKITNISNIEKLTTYFNAQNTTLVVGMNIPEFQNLQNKSFNINFNITGNNEQELFNNYKHVNQLLQDCITY